MRSLVRVAGRSLAFAVGFAAISYVAYVVRTWLRYGDAPLSRASEEPDALLDQFMPLYDIVELHQVRVIARRVVRL